MQQKIDEKNYLKDRTDCKNGYIMNRRKNKNQQPKIDNTIHKEPIKKTTLKTKHVIEN